MDHLFQKLEDRRLMSASLIDEPVSEYASLSQTVRIAYLPELNIGHVSQLRGEITWGDGSASPAGFDRNKNGGIDVTGVHAFAKPGTYTITAQLIETPYTGGGGPIPQYILNLGEVDTTAAVTAAPPILKETAGDFFTAALGTIHTVRALEIAYTATVDWGDGNKTAGTITFLPPAHDSLLAQTVVVTGSHSYPNPGLYKVVTRVYRQLVIVGQEGDPTLEQTFVTLVRVTA